jgi:3-deoxy-D-manno-octulosonic-acid transferase
LYNLAIQLYALGIRFAAIFNPKAKQWLEGRKDLFQHIQNTYKKTPNGKTHWIHVASLGEFEQGRPLIEQLKKKYPDCQIVLTFFSPSGYEMRKNYPLADAVYYLPLDTANNAKRFIELIKPDSAIFVKYEFWHYYLSELKKKQIPTLLISATFRPNQLFFNKLIGNFHRKMLACFTHIFLQDQASAKLLETINISNYTVAGDTRVDRVLDIANPENNPLPNATNGNKGVVIDKDLLQKFSANHNVLICGSTWFEDEKIICHYINQHQTSNSNTPSDLQPTLLINKYIIAPHEIHEDHLAKLENLIDKKYMRYSFATQLDKPEIEDVQVLIIDNIGLLSTLYSFGKIAYIGGGFGKGIHNTLEPAAFGLPILFGPNYKKFIEAIDLIKTQGAYTIQNQKQFDEKMTHLSNNENYLHASQHVNTYMQQNKGATNKIIKEL